MASNPLPDFISKFCDRDFNVFISCSELKNAYTTYLISKKKRVVSWKAFKDALEREGLFVEKTTKQVYGNWVCDRYVMGIKLKENWKENIEKTRNYDFYDNYDSVSYSLNSYIGDMKSGHKSHNCHNLEKINLPCKLCGVNLVPNLLTEQGPMCENCIKNAVLNEEKVV